ncbi:hypothetical protein F2P81_011957 [Scophthalmus maximus]|uniref:Uncharacterized protein n=1 Tax=Scophthalmus maximus TaxID=52904 RepID=A0A6A4SVD0_SCOMX|nr:hypothetical protein F2P81_011957 [Scophthalmus maximus]
MGSGDSGTLASSPVWLAGESFSPEGANVKRHVVSAEATQISTEVASLLLIGNLAVPFLSSYPHTQLNPQCSSAAFLSPRELLPQPCC